MAHITLLGTVHLDPDGYVRLLELLDAHSPTLVFVDVSPYAIEFRSTQGLCLLDRLDAFRGPDDSLPPALQPVEAQLKLPYEYTAACDYAHRAAARTILVGDSDLSRSLLQVLTDELMPLHNLEFLATLDEPALHEQVAAQWRRARQCLEAAAPPTPAPEDERLACEIRRQVGQERAIHVGGWNHLPPLARLLADLEPQLLLLEPLP